MSTQSIYVKRDEENPSLLNLNGLKLDIEVLDYEETGNILGEVMSLVESQKAKVELARLSYQRARDKESELLILQRDLQMQLDQRQPKITLYSQISQESVVVTQAEAIGFVASGNWDYEPIVSSMSFQGE